MREAARCDVIVLLGIHRLGGAELSLLSIANGLQKNGFNVLVAAFGRRCDLAKQAMPDLAIHDLGAQSSLKALLPVVSLIKQTQAKVLISGLRVPNIIAMFASRFAGTNVRTVLTEHTPREAPVSGMKQQFIRQLTDSLYPRANAVVAVSHGIQKSLSRFMDPARLHVIHNPVIKENSVPLPPAHPWLNPAELPVVMGIGRLSKEKNFALLLNAFAAASLLKPMRLMILGEGDDRMALEVLAQKLGLEKLVIFPGFVENIAGWLPHAKLFVCSSLYEGFGNAIVEALHYRVPVVATDCPVGPGEILGEAQYGYLALSNDPKSLEAAVLAALDVPKDPQAGYARAQMFSEMNCINAYGDLIRQLVSA